MVKRLKIFLSGCFCWIALVDTASNLFQKRIWMQPSGSADSGVSMLLCCTALRSYADLKWICEIDCMSMCTWLCSTSFFNATFQCTIKVNVHERLHRPVGSNANRLVRLNQFRQRVSHLTEFMRRCHWPWMKSVHWCLHLSLGCRCLENMILFYQGYPLKILFKASYKIKMQSPIE